MSDPHHEPPEGQQRAAMSATRDLWIPLATTLSGCVTLFGVFAPWLRSGTSTRSSFELLDIVERLGFAPGGLFEWTVRAWPVVPLLIVGAIVGSWSARHRWATGLGAVGGFYVGAVAVAVRRAPNAGLIRIEWGSTVALLGSLGLGAAAAATAMAVRRSTGPGRRTPA